MTTAPKATAVARAAAAEGFAAGALAVQGGGGTARAAADPSAGATAGPGIGAVIDMNDVVGTHDILFVTLDTLRYDVAAELAADGRTPNLVRALPGGRWQRRHTPATFTYAAHHAFFAGFLPTPADPTPVGSGPAEFGPVGVGGRGRLFAARFPGSESTMETTWVFDQPDVVTGLAAAGYHTVCVGGVGFFNRLSPLGRVLPDLFAESHWAPELGVTEPDSLRYQLDRVAQVVATGLADRPLFLFLNVSAVHQPNRHYRRGSTVDSRESHGAALEYVDGHVPRLFRLMTGRDRPCFVILCSDHGTAYGEDGVTGHRVAQEAVWTVPYAEFIIHKGQW